MGEITVPGMTEKDVQRELNFAINKLCERRVNIGCENSNGNGSANKSGSPKRRSMIVTSFGMSEISSGGGKRVKRNTKYAEEIPAFKIECA
jgi:hypothetical protein